MYNTCSTWLNVGLLVPCRKNDSSASTVSGSSNSSNPLMLCETDGSSVREDEDGKLGMMSSSLNESVRSRISSASSACSTTPSMDASLASAGGVSAPGSAAKSEKGPSEPAADPYRTPDFYIIRVSLESSTEATEGKS